MPSRNMSSIIRQNTLPALPDFRNLGTVLRILVAVNGGALVVAFARDPAPAATFAGWTAAVTVVEPYLFLVLVALWIGSPWLGRMRYGIGVSIVMLVVTLAGIAIFQLFRGIEALPPAYVLEWIVWGLFAAATLLFYFALRARALSPALVEARLAALQARIRPHFLFNSINAVLSLVRSEPRRAERALEDMADLFRVLMRDNRELTPLADELELCRQYLELEQLRLGERLVVDWNLKSMPADALIPPLVLQPLLENAVYHGIEPSSAPGVVSINVFLTRGYVHAVLKNPYRRDGGHHAGNKMALANVRERLALHFDAEASLESRVTRDGYEVHIRMPYRAADTDAAQRASHAAAAPGRERGNGNGTRRVSASPFFAPRGVHA